MTLGTSTDQGLEGRAEPNLSPLEEKTIIAQKRGRLRGAWTCYCCYLVTKTFLLVFPLLINQ